MIFSSHVDILVHSLLSPWFLWHSILLILLWPIFSLHLCCFFGRIIDLYLCLITQLCLTLGLLCPWDFFRQEYWSELPFPSSRGSSRPRDQGSNLYLADSLSHEPFEEWHNILSILLLLNFFCCTFVDSFAGLSASTQSVSFGVSHPCASHFLPLKNLTQVQGSNY